MKQDPESGRLGSMNITKFLESRIAEDEAAAKIAKAEFAHAGYGSYGPSRVLAECVAKRAIIALADRVESLDYALMDARGGFADLGSDILEAIAAVYKDHPDYRQEWAVVPQP